MIRYRIFRHHEGRDRDRDGRGSYNGLRFEIRDVTNGALWTVKITIHNVLDRYGRYGRDGSLKTRDLGAFLH